MESDRQVEFDRVRIEYAYRIAMEESTDPSTQNGAVLVDARGTVLVAAANRFPRNVAESGDRWERPLKYSYVEHAERNVIYAAAKAGIKVGGLTMYVPWYACAECARAIIQSGVKEVVGHKAIFDRTMDRWKDSIAVAHGMLDEAGIKHRLYDGYVEDIEIRFDGELWKP